MLKLLMTALLCNTILLANSDSYGEIENFYKNSIAEDKQYKLNKITVHNHTKIEKLQGWTAYFVTLQMEIQERNITLKDVIFYDGVFISKDFINYNNKNSLKSNTLQKWDEYVK